MSDSLLRRHSRLCVPRNTVYVAAREPLVRLYVAGNRVYELLMMRQDHGCRQSDKFIHRGGDGIARFYCGTVD